MGMADTKDEKECDDDDADCELDLVVVEVPPVGTVEGEVGGVGFEEAVEAEGVME